jgi:protein Mpv17
MPKGAVEGRPVDVTVTKYKEDLWDNCKALWMIWVPAQLFNFSVVPHHLRIPFGERAAAATGLPPQP